MHRYRYRLPDDGAWRLSNTYASRMEARMSLSARRARGYVVGWVGR
jgi:hypothetical protein